MPSFHRKMENRLRTPEQGADTVVYLAAAHNIPAEHSGKFFQDRVPVAKHIRLAGTHTSEDRKEALMKKLADYRKGLFSRL